MHKLSKIFTLKPLIGFRMFLKDTNADACMACYRLEVIITGDADIEHGWVMDFGTIKNPLQPILETLDHSYLNEIPGLENPTSENIAKWIWERLKPELPLLSEIIISETSTSCCSYRG